MAYAEGLRLLSSVGYVYEIVGSTKVSPIWSFKKAVRSDKFWVSRGQKYGECLA